MRRQPRVHPMVTTTLAAAIAAIAVIAIAHVTGADAIGRAFNDVDPVWIALVAGAQLLTYPAYIAAYRAVAALHGHAPLSLPVVSRIVVAGFGPFALGGGFGVDVRVLETIHEDERSARVRVMALGIFEWAVLAPTACITAIVLLAQRADIMPSLLWPWALAVPPCCVLAVWASRPSRSRRLAGRWGGRLDLLVQMLEGIDGVRRMITEDPLHKLGAWLGIAVYWAADMCALWAALRTFGLSLDVGRLIIAYATGYAATRRSLPLGGAGATEALMTFALYWVRQPLAPALAAVMLYRVFNFVLIAIPAVVAHRQLEPMLAGMAVRRRRRRLRPSRRSRGVE
ncbi:MAG: flippase-like domain-containing protein [Acidobacteriota bacterium]|nr:flippase-like domain-containing protein [Acidobacteriota bacterium]